MPPAMDHIFCFAPSINPVMEPVVSSTNTTSASIASSFLGPGVEVASAAAAMNVTAQNVARTIFFGLCFIVGFLLLIALMIPHLPHSRNHFFIAHP